MTGSDLSGTRVTVMGLGLHGGGIETARYLCRHGAIVTVTDTRPESVLAPSVERLEGLPIRYVLGRHEKRDFSDADFVVKNPAVPRNAPLLSLARAIETDISLFLRSSRNPLIAVTGTKGKSTTVSAIHQVLALQNPGARLGGNITVSPLTFVDEITPDVPVVLELSSFQLGDLTVVSREPGVRLLSADVAAITNIMPDHQNYYHSMDLYIQDKEVIYRHQKSEGATLCNYDQDSGHTFADETPARPWFFSRNRLPAHVPGAYLHDGKGIFRTDGGEAVVIPRAAPLNGEHERINLLIAALALSVFGVPASSIRKGLSSFRGVEHRMEAFLERNGISFINDSAATIPEATLAAASSLNGRVILVAGGTDKALTFDLFPQIARSVDELHLLSGSATEKIIPILEDEGLLWYGPHNSLEACLDSVIRGCVPGTTVLFSPGCASFGMFLNEFDRGRRFKEMVYSRFEVGPE